MHPRVVKKCLKTQNEIKQNSYRNKFGIYIESLYGNEWKKHLIRLKEHKRNFENQHTLKSLMEWEDVFQKAITFIMKIKGKENSNRLKTWEDCLEIYSKHIKMAEESLAISTITANIPK